MAPFGEPKIELHALWLGEDWSFCPVILLRAIHGALAALLFELKRCGGTVFHCRNKGVHEKATDYFLRKRRGEKNIKLVLLLFPGTLSVRGPL